MISNEYTYTLTHTHTYTHAHTHTHSNTPAYKYTHTNKNTKVIVMQSNLARAVGRSSFWAAPLCMWLSSMRGPGNRRRACTAVCVYVCVCVCVWCGVVEDELWQGQEEMGGKKERSKGEKKMKRRDRRLKKYKTLQYTSRTYVPAALLVPDLFGVNSNCTKRAVSGA